MDAPITSRPAGQPLGQPLAPSSPVTPTVAPDGTPLSTKQRFDIWKQNPENVAAAMQPGTMARQQLEQFQRDLATEADAVQRNPVLAMEPAKDAGQYRLGFDAHSNSDSQAFDAMARSWLLASGAPADLGSSFAEHLANVGRKLQGADDLILEKHDRDSRAAFERVYGLDAAKQLAKVAEFLEDIEDRAPGVLDFVESNPHVFRDAMTLRYLAMLADAHAARRSAA